MTEVVNTLKEAVTRQLSSRAVFPEGAVVSIAYAKVFGPFDAVTPEGHPITISSGPFDENTETPTHAIAAAALKRFGIGIVESDWELELDEDVVHPAGGSPIPYNRLYHFFYKEEQWKWDLRGLHDGNVKNHFKDSHYLTKSWQGSVETNEQAALSAPEEAA